MLLRSQNPVLFFTELKKCVRKGVGSSFTAILNRWRNTRSDDSAPALVASVERFMVRVGVLDAGDVVVDRRKKYSEFIQSIERATGEAPGVIDALLNAFAGGAYGLNVKGVCGEIPQCTICPISGNCRFLDAGAQDRGQFGVLEIKGLGGKAAKSTFGEASSSDKRSLSQLMGPSRGAADLLAFLVAGERSGAGKAAGFEALLKEAGGLRGLLAADIETIERAGLTRDEVVRLQAVSGVCQLWKQELEPRGTQFRHGGDFFDAYHLRLRSEKKEKFYVVCLDQKHRRLGDEMVSEGSLTETLVHPREVFAPAIRLRAAAVVVIHNHPSGDPTPSPEDRQMTTRLSEAADLVGIPLLDHVVIGDGRYISFVDKGWL